MHTENSNNSNACYKQKTRIPGHGFEGFLPDRAKFDKAGRTQKKKIIDGLLNEVFIFGEWHDVLKAFALKPVEVKERNTKIASYHGMGGGESELHKKLKKYIGKHPEVIGLNKKISSVKIGHTFPSADAVDVLFKSRNEWIGVEVKTRNSNLQDIERGLFQCVKYQALIEAEQKVENAVPNSRSLLVMENHFPKELIGIKNILGVEVKDNIKVI